jgi:hypothetical protein
MVGGCDFISPKRWKLAKEQHDITTKLEKDLKDNFNIEKVNTSGNNALPITEELTYSSFTIWLWVNDDSNLLKDSTQLNAFAKKIGNFSIEQLNEKFDIKVVTLLFLDADASQLETFNNSRYFYFNPKKGKGQRMISLQEKEQLNQ